MNAAWWLCVGVVERTLTVTTSSTGTFFLVHISHLPWVDSGSGAARRNSQWRFTGRETPRHRPRAADCRRLAQRERPSRHM